MKNILGCGSSQMINGVEKEVLDFVDETCKRLTIKRIKYLIK